MYDLRLLNKIEIDASNLAIDACFNQEHENMWHSITYLSRKLLSIEQNYDIHDKELLAIVTCDRCKRKEQKHSWLKDKRVNLSAVLDQGSRAYPLRHVPELPSWRKNSHSGSSHYFRSVSMKSGSGSSKS
jgi:hypothetical protein